MGNKLIKMIFALASTFLLNSVILAEEQKDNKDSAPALSSVKVHSTIDTVIQDLANRLLTTSKIPKDQESNIAITSFVDLHQFDKTTHFGRTLSEGFFDELFIRGFQVSDFRAQQSLSINKAGEYFLTRDPKHLQETIHSDYTLVGTYTIFENKILINARILDNLNGKILASARTNYLTNDCRVLQNCKKPRTINIVSNSYKTHSSRENLSVVDKKSIPLKQHFIKNKYSEQDEIIEAKTKTQFPLVNLIK